MGQRKKPIEPPNQLIEGDHLARIHPSLKANFVPLPEINNSLTNEQLAEIFGGDWNALRDVVRLARQVTPESIE
jgi:hypothetical protein